MTTASFETRLLVGALNVSCLATSFAGDSQRATHDRTGLCDRNKVFILGRRSSTSTIGLMYDDDTTPGSYLNEFIGNYTADTLLPVTVGVAGVVHGGPVWCVEARQMAYKPTGAADGTVDASLELDVTGVAGFGHSLHTVTTPVTATGDDTSLDGGSATSGGGVAHLHCTAVSGTGPTCDVVIEHSTNNTDWDTLAVFTQLEGNPAAERVVVPAGTVRRYLRASYTVAGSDPSYTIAVAFARS